MDFINSLIAAPFVCIGWVIVGAIAGALANNIMKSSQPLINDIILGLIGSFIGGILLGVLGIGTPEGGLQGMLANIVVATLGAIVLIAIARAVKR